MSTEFVQISDIYLKDVEDFVMRLVVNKTIIYAEIDCPTGVVSFQQTKDPSEVLNEVTRPQVTHDFGNQFTRPPI